MGTNDQYIYDQCLMDQLSLLSYDKQEQLIYGILKFVLVF
jgi:hypothetical protein